MSRRPCDTCGGYGHGAFHCPLKVIQDRQDPYRMNPPRPPGQPLSYPALRDAGASTVFMIRPQRIV